MNTFLMQTKWVKLLQDQRKGQRADLSLNKNGKLLCRFYPDKEYTFIGIDAKALANKLKSKGYLTNPKIFDYGTKGASVTVWHYTTKIQIQVKGQTKIIIFNTRTFVQAVTGS